jgi:hypothetical protein
MLRVYVTTQVEPIVALTFRASSSSVASQALAPEKPAREGGEGARELA